MIFDIFLNDDHDIELDGADLAMATEDNIVKQRLSIRLQFLLEEWFLDTTKGLPYTQTIFAQGTSLDTTYGLFYTETRDTEDVESIESLTLTPDPEDKGLAVSFSVNKGTITDTIEVTI